jgi:AraC-like DNA-binding protein
MRADSHAVGLRFVFDRMAQRPSAARRRNAASLAAEPGLNVIPEIASAGGSVLNVAHAVTHGDFGRACVYALDRGMVPHAHREGHLIFHLAGPAAEMVIDGRSHPLKPGVGVAINPWQAHYCRTLDSSSHVLMLVIYIKPQWFFRVSNQTRDQLQFGSVAVSVTEPIAALVCGIQTMLAEHSDDDLRLENAMTKLATAAHAQTWASNCALNRDIYGPPKIFDFRIRRALRLLDDTVSEPVDLASVSRAAGLSRPHFFKLFREQIGVPPTIYVNALRLERAIDRLALGEDNVAEIGFDLGFATPASFSRFFAANSVVPPGAYRRSVHARALQS